MPPYDPLFKYAFEVREDFLNILVVTFPESEEGKKSVSACSGHRYAN